MQATRWVGLLTASAMLGLCGPSAQASVVQTTIIGVFGGVITQGNLLHYPTLQSETYFDNSATADYSIVNGTNPATSGTPAIQSTGSSLIFGDDYGGAGEPSILDFFGAVIPSDITQPFRIGRLTYRNGRSNTTSQIFGATISFYDGVVSPGSFLGTDTIAINITADFQQSTSQDADYINICGNQSNICANSIDAVETQEGGTGVTVDLYGTIVGDPQLFLNAVSVIPGQSSTTNGFVGSDRPLSIPIPEPSSGLLLLAGLIALLVSLRRRLADPITSALTVANQIMTRRIDMRRIDWIGALAAMALCGASVGAARASVVPSTIIGVFGGVITSGNVLHDPDIASTTYIDNAGTASYSIVNSGATSTTGSPPIQSTGSALIWGDDNGGNGQPSTLDFFGAVIPANVDTPFFIGRLTYGNGTSSLPSLIFGATISFYDGVVSPAAFLGTDTIVINTTSNLGAAVSQDADYLNICGNQSNICANSIDAIESSQGGTGLTVDLYGTIVGDPQLFLDAVSVSPGQSATTNGFVGSDRPLAIPEPTSALLLGIAMVGPLVSRRRRVRAA